MATGDITQAPKPNAGSNQRFDLVDHQLIADAFKAFVDATHRGLAASPVSTAGAPTGELWLGTITANPTALDGLVQVDSPLCVGLDADGGLVLVPDGVALTAAIPDDSSDYQVYLYSAGVSENSQVRRFLPAASPFTEFTQAQDIHVRDTATMFTRAGAVGSVVADDVAGGVTRPLLFLGVANNTGGAVTFTPAANRLETVTAPTNLPASSTGDVAGTTFSTGDQATLRGMLNAAMHAVARDRWLGSTIFTPSAANNFGAYNEPPAGIDVAVRSHLDFITIGEDSSSSFGTLNRGNYASDDLLLVAALAALPSTGGTIYIKPGFTLDNFAANVPIPADTRVKFQSDVRRSLSRTTFNMSDYRFVCASGGTLGAVSFEDCTFFNVSPTTDGSIIELHDAFEFRMDGCFLAASTTNVGVPVAAVSVNAATVNLKGITIKNTSMSYSNGSSDGGAHYLLDTGVVQADSVLVQGISAVCTGDSTADHNGAIIDIGAAGRHVRILDCDFSSVGETSASGVTLMHAIRLTSLVFTEFDTFNRRISGCSFRGRTTSGGGIQGALGGISLTNVKDIIISECVFEECKNPITFGVNGLYTAGRLDGVVKDCIFRDGIAARPDAISLSVSGVLIGLKITGNTFDSIDVSLIAANDDLEDVEFAGNTLTDCPFEARGQTYVDNLDIHNNTFESNTDSLVAPIIGSVTSTLRNIVFRDNVVRGYSTTTVDDFVFGLDVRATDINSIKVHGNTFEDMQNVAYTGVNAVDRFRVIGMHFDTGGLISVCRNHFTNVAVTISGTNARSLQLIKLASIIANGVGVVENVMVQGNTSGSRFQHVQPLHCRDLTVQNCHISDNSFMYFRQIGTIAAGVFADLVLDRPNNVLAAGGSLIIANNTFDRGGTTSAHFIAVTAGNPFHFKVISITGNTFKSQATLNDHGYMSETTPDAFIFTNNYSQTSDFSLSNDPGGAAVPFPAETLPPGINGLANNAAVADNINVIMDV